MSARMLLRIVLVLAGLVVLWGALALFRRPARDASGALALPRLSLPDLSRIEIRQGPDTAVVVREGERWRVNGLPAAGTAVAAFVAALNDSAAPGELVSESAISHERLGVDSLHGRRLTLVTAGPPALDLWVGMRGPDFEGFYVRRAGEAPVYLLKGAFAERMMQPEEQWRDRQVAQLPADSIGRIEIRRGRATWALGRTAGGWRLADGVTDSVAAARLVTQFGDVRAAGFPDAQGPAPDFAAAERGVTVYGLAGQPLLALAMDSTESGAFWVRREADGVVFRIERRVADQIAPEERALRS
ncbi:MAG: DUF4340 domain-containing protein [Gemmatimonadetes bacterium]|nr:DUF4340 domain-containing protein [Gemmatimonadota bacterium]